MVEQFRRYRPDIIGHTHWMTNGQTSRRTDWFQYKPPTLPTPPPPLRPRINTERYIGIGISESLRPGYKNTAMWSLVHTTDSLLEWSLLINSLPLKTKQGGLLAQLVIACGNSPCSRISVPLKHCRANFKSQQTTACGNGLWRALYKLKRWADCHNYAWTSAWGLRLAIFMNTRTQWNRSSVDGPILAVSLFGRSCEYIYM